MLEDYKVYSMSGDCVVIHRAFGREQAYNRASVLLAIRNTKSQRAAYATEGAYQASLALFEGALAYMDAHTEAAPA